MEWIARPGGSEGLEFSPVSWVIVERLDKKRGNCFFTAFCGTAMTADARSRENAQCSLKYRYLYFGSCSYIQIRITTKKRIYNR